MKEVTQLALTTVLALILISCAYTGAATSPTAATAQIETPQFECTAPTRVVLLVDKTGSAERHRTPLVKPEDLDPLYEILLACGGEIAAGQITDRSNRPLLRVRLDEPELPPPPTSQDRNPFEYGPLRRAELARRQLVEEHNRQREQDGAERIRLFDQELSPLLSAAPSHPCSDVNGGLNRAALFHEEPDLTWNRAPRKYTLMVSDAEHNCGAPQRHPLAGVRLMMINGEAGYGSLRPDEAVRLERFDAALRLILTEYARKEN